MKSNQNIWESLHIDLGKHKENTRVKVSFKALVEPDIKKIKVGCKSCTRVLGFNPETMTLDVIYSIAPIPFHLRVRPYINSRKVIQVFYKDKTNDILTFVTQVTR